MRYFLITLAAIFIISCGNDNRCLSPEEYIIQNSLEAQELGNGVYIVIHDEGKEVKPNIEDVVDVSYIGKLTDDIVFDTNNEFKALLADLIPGWFIGLKEIGEGGSCTLIIPHEMAFGAIENGPIPAKSTVVFDIELKKIFTSLSVDEYISEYELNTTLLEKGVNISIQEEGNEIRPNLESEIIVNYTGMMTNTLIFDQGENISFRLSNLIEGWQIGLQEIGEGGICTLIVPANAAYGPFQSGIIPPNSPLVFEIELIKVN